MTQPNGPLDRKALQEQLGSATGPDYWRSLEELSQAPEFQALLEREMPSYAGGLIEGVNRRQFLALLGGSLALAGFGGCYTRPRDNIFPYVHQPPEMVPGVPLFFATAMPQSGYGMGLLVESHEGRPTKVEGNPTHPSSLPPRNTPDNTRNGPTNAQAQASILSLYDPDRSRSVTYRGDVSSWDAFTEVLGARLYGTQTTEVNRNLRIRLLTETVTSPTLAHQIYQFLERFPQAKWHVYEPAGRDNARIGARHALGREVDTIYDFTQADVVLSLDADFLNSGPGQVRYARDFSSRRLSRAYPEGDERRMNRLYVVESMHTVTGWTADHRWPMKAAAVESFARAVAARLGVPGVEAGQGPAHPVAVEWVRALAADLQDRRQRGRSIVLAGAGQPPIVHALAHKINEFLGNVGTTVTYIEPVEFRPPPGRGMPASSSDDPVASLRELVDDLSIDPEDTNRDRRRRAVDILLILGGNPVYTAPADLPLRERMARPRLRVHLGLYQDETAELCEWHIPEAHYLEAWGDVRSHDGTVTVIQPLIAPFYGGRTAHEMLALLNGGPETRGHDIVRAYWNLLFGLHGNFQSPLLLPSWPLEGPLAAAGDFDSWWRQVLHEGKVPGTASPRITPRVGDGWANAPGAARGSGEGLEIVFRSDPAVGDGRFANNGWLQEMPRPISHLTWDNAAYLSPSTAVRLGFAPEDHPERANGRVVTLRYRGRPVEAPLWVLPAHANDSITVHLGYGRTRVGRVGNGVGFNAYTLRTSEALWFDSGLEAPSAGRSVALACTQHHHLMHGRELIYDGTPDHPPPTPTREQRRPEAVVRPGRHEDQPGWQGLSLYPNDFPHNSGNQWGMAIDLTLCTGCSACVVACQAENNIPVVGKAQVLAGREMHWIRIDSYYQGDLTHPELLRTYAQPVPCMQCENAPCELVCPVEATSHSDDGLNEMTYNRCVGTRYCSNNCPYKVRRFNFLQYSDVRTESLQPMYNPEVTVRSRGVMEKCTYCVQRIRNGQIVAEREGRDLVDYEILTACQAACPAGAITFGDMRMPGQQPGQSSRVKRLKDSPLNYGLLGELNTRPRTTYLAALKNPNPNIPRPDGVHE